MFIGLGSDLSIGSLLVLCVCFGLILRLGAGLILLIGRSLVFLLLHHHLQFLSCLASLIGLGAIRRELQVSLEIFQQRCIVAQLDMNVCKDQVHRGIVRLQVPSLFRALLGLFWPLERRKRPCHFEVAMP